MRIHKVRESTSHEWNKQCLTLVLRPRVYTEGLAGKRGQSGCDRSSRRLDVVKHGDLIAMIVTLDI